jgi:NADPH2:quinone reductase
MPYPRVIPHSDGSGIVDSVGAGVDAGRVGRRVWVYGAQSYRPLGTAAQFTVIPGITARRTVFVDGPVSGRTVLVHGVLGGVGALSSQLARWGDATVIGTVRRSADLEEVDTDMVTSVVALDQPDPVAAIRQAAGGGVDRIIEVAFSDNVDLDAAVAKNGAIIAAYATREDRPDFPFWSMLFHNITIRLLGSDDFPVAAKQQAATDLTNAAKHRALSIRVGMPIALSDPAVAHDLVDTGARERVLLRVAD